MCINIKNKEPLIATEDIKTYKIVYFNGLIFNTFINKYNETYGKFIYRVGKTYKTKLTIAEATHYDGTFETSEGFYSFHNDRPLNEYFDNGVLLKCVIPKGSNYYYKENVYVSDKIIIKSAQTNIIKRLKKYFSKK